MSVNHATQAERYLSKASWMTGDGPGAEFVNPRTAAVLAQLAQAHAALAHLPEQQVIAQAELREAQTALTATRRVVGDVIGETLVDGPPAAAHVANCLAYTLRARHLSVDGQIAARMEGLGHAFDPDAEVVVEEPTAHADEVLYKAAFLACRRALVDFLTDELACMSDERWEAANRLATVLDGIGVNVDNDVDYQLAHQTDMGMTSRTRPSKRFPEFSDEPPF